MRILMITHLLPYPPRAGCSLRNFNLIRECAKNNEIHLITFYQKAHVDEPDKFQDSIEEMRKHCRVVKVFEIPTDGKKLAWYALLFINLFSPTPYSAWRFSSKAMRRAIKEHASRYSFDLVEIGTIALANFAKLVPELPRLMIHHNIESELLFRRSASLKRLFTRAYVALQARKLRRFEKSACDRFHHHTTVSERDKHVLQELGPHANVTVVPNGVDTSYFTPMNGSCKERRLVFVGSMTWYPNLDAMLHFTRDIWHLIRHGAPDVSMDLIGSSPSPEIVEFGRENSSFRVRGFVDDVRPYIAEAAVYVVPIRVGGGTRLKILDAMAMGKAIVSTSIGCEGIDVTDGEDIIIADDPVDFARKTTMLLNDQELRERLGRNARRKAEDLYSWEKIAPKLENVYRELAELRR